MIWSRSQFAKESLPLQTWIREVLPLQHKGDLCCSEQPPPAVWLSSGAADQVRPWPRSWLVWRCPTFKAMRRGPATPLLWKPTTACTPLETWQHANDSAEASALPLHGLLTRWISFCSCSGASHHLHVLRGRCCVEDKTTFCSAPVKCN